MNTPRMFVCGDIHGEYDQLMQKLDDIGFDKTKDMLYALGDLVDRGPESMKVLRLLYEPWFDSIKGNHELMVEMNYQGEDSYEMHRKNGGNWFDLMDQTEKDEAFTLCQTLPLAMTVDTPSGKRIGLVHAEIPGNDWNEFEAMIGSTNEGQVEAAWATGLWSRTKIKRATAGEDLQPVRGVDMVYMGHTPMTQVVQCQNMRWIDTGAYWKGGYLTIEELH